MTATPRLALTVAALAATALVTAPTGYAAAITVGPGDLIETNTASCTIAYTYTGRDDHTYAITAGHCEDTPHAAVEDQTGGAAGTFTRTVVDPPGSGGSDYGLIDFGLKPLAVHTLAQRPVASAHPEPHPGQTVCRSGITTGRHCGTIAAVYGPHQYLTTGMATSPRRRLRRTGVDRGRRRTRPNHRSVARRADHRRRRRLRPLRRPGRRVRHSRAELTTIAWPQGPPLSFGLAFGSPILAGGPLRATPRPALTLRAHGLSPLFLTPQFPQREHFYVVTPAVVETKAHHGFDAASR